MKSRRLIIVSGRSGSGKTISLHVLEDLGYYCVDNLPVNMLPDLVGRLQEENPHLAVSIDARNLPSDVNLLKEVISTLRQPGWYTDLIYLDADQNSLLRRFSETRRRHPLTNTEISLQEAIEHERILLSPLASMADIIIDTSRLTQHELCRSIRERVARENPSQLHLLIQSFGFKQGSPVDADFVFDVRCLSNPFWQADLRHLNGQHDKVIDYLEQDPKVNEMSRHIIDFLQKWIPHFEADNRSYLTVCIGCTGGQHRSVYIAELLFKHAQALNWNSQLRHRDMKKEMVNSLQ